MTLLFDHTIHSYDDARQLAKRHLPWLVFDYIDGAAGGENGEAKNRHILRDICLQPRALVNVEHRDISTKIFGKTTKLPFGISPMGMCNLVSHQADETLAAFSAKHNVPLGISTVASTSLETMIKASNGNAWFQLYYGGNKQSSFELIDRAKAAGYQTLIFTVDVPEVGRRPRELRRGFKMPFKIGVPQFIDFACHPWWSLPMLFKGAPQMANFGGEFGEFDRTSSRAGVDWQFLKQIREKWTGNLVIKGVLSVDDALELKRFGVDAIQVSSHGGRQLDSAPPPILMLKAIRQAIGPEFPLFYDSGIRSGEDIIKAYAYGANFVFLGRPFLYAMAANGEKGLDDFGKILTAETSIALAQIGLCDMQTISEDAIVKL